MFDINYDVISSVLGKLSSPKDADYEALMKIDSNNEGEVRSVIKKWVVPYFQSFDESSKELIKETFRFALTAQTGPFERIFDRIDIPFSPPENPIDFYFWLWDELFNCEFEPVENLGMYKETDDLNVVYRLKKKQG